MVSASCSKLEFSDNSNSVSGNIKLNVTVADLSSGEPSTKAKIKTNWENEDQIKIWYDSNTQSEPDLVITYDSSTGKWTGPESITAPSGGSGNLKCLYDGHVKVASTTGYSYSNSTLSFHIVGWTFLTQIQVVVTGISGSASNYTLACDKFTPLSGDAYTVGADAITASKANMCAAATGFASAANTGAATFVFATSDYTTESVPAAPFTFTLTNTATSETKVYTTVAKSFTSSAYIKALALAYSDFSAVPAVLLSGEFSVSDTKKVKFTRGNLYHDGSVFRCETSQYSYPISISGYRASYFFWTKTAAASYASSYDDGTNSPSDRFFADESTPLTVDGQNNLYALSKNEWVYLIQTRANASSLHKNNVSVCGVGCCLVIAPDGFSGTIAGSYDASAWASAEASGFVCLPPAGYHNGSSFEFAPGQFGNYWSSTPLDNDANYVHELFFSNESVGPSDGCDRQYALSVRLVGSVSN